MRFRVALLQIAPHGNDQRKNLGKGVEYCRKAKALGADLAVFPELWNIGGGLPCGDTPAIQRQWSAAAIDQQSEFFSAFASLAREIKINIAVSYLEASDPKPRNSVSILDTNGEVALTYSKVCICDFPADGDQVCGCDVNCSAGDSFDVCRLSGADGEVAVGAMICADREFPEPATRLMLNGAELIVVTNACDWDDVRAAGLLTRASENLVGVAMANYPRPGNNGHSCAYSCVTWKGRSACDPLIAATGEEEEILMADFDVDEIREVRRSEAWRMAHRHRFAR